MIILINLFIYGNTEFTTSHAKYYKESATNEKLKYETSISKLNYSGDNSIVSYTLDMANSDPYEARFNVTFKRNNIMYTDNTATAGTASDKSDIDVYYFTLSNSNCSIISVHTNDNIDSTIPVRTLATSQINYYENTADTVQIKVKCDVDKSDSYITRAFKVDERIMHDDDSTEELFDYTSYFDNTLSVAEYYSIVGQPPATDYYDAAYEALQTRYSSNTSEEKDAVEDYFNSVYKYDDNGTMKPLPDTSFTTVSLDGFTYDLGAGTYTFDDKFLGYALTYHICTNRGASQPYNFVYSTADTNENILSSFGTYIDKYGSTYLKANKIKVMNYISGVGVPGLLNNSISFITSTYDGTHYPYRLIFNDSVVSEINNLTATNVFEIGNGIDPDDMYASYNEKVTDFITFDGELLALAVNNDEFDYSEIDQAPDWIKSAVKNNNQMVKQTFSDMYLLKTANSAVLLDIYSTAGANNYLGIYRITAGETITLTLKDGESMNNIYTMVNRINNEVLHPDAQIDITDLGTLVGEDDGVKHYSHTATGLTFDVYTESGITYVTYTLS